MSPKRPEFQVKLAETEAEIAAAQRLRYRVFVEELGASGPDVNHTLTLEADRYDLHAEHLLLIDRQQSFNLGVVGTYRLLPDQKAVRTEGFYSEDEFDLAPLRQNDRRVLELGRSCVLEDYRGGTAMFELWAGLAEYVLTRDFDVLFGVASFHGTDLLALAEPLTFLHMNHLAPPGLRVSAKGDAARAMDLLPADAVDRRRAMLAMPPLIKAYLRLGGVVGQGAWLDHAFNTTEVCMVLDVAAISARHRALYSQGRLAS
ncbi:MAG: GNAT family N-acyltransferase [Pseudomonadota bacterium]